MAFLRAWRMSFDEAPIAGRLHDQVIRKVQHLRMALGLGAGIWLIVSYPLSNGGAEFILGKIVELGFACAILAAASGPGTCTRCSPR
ncbi:hypothetical protein [Streptomyces sp. NPDC058623]|uniref:hypothetical protein n=1 Tax=Streptomyces sp. NPDC058623 TaxID=3346563 RepID=UPI003656275C